MINREISALYPPFANLVFSFISRWNHENPLHPIQLFEGLRSFDRQAELYAVGRSAEHPGAKVTNAQPGFSWHQYGLGADIVFDADPVKPGPQWSWDGKSPWPKLGQMGDQQFDLEWAGMWKSFPEYPHFQKTYGMQLSEARELYAIGELPAVWAALDLSRQVIARG